MLRIKVEKCFMEESSIGVSMHNFPNVSLFFSSNYAMNLNGTCFWSFDASMTIYSTLFNSWNAYFNMSSLKKKTISDKLMIRVFTIFPVNLIHRSISSFELKLSELQYKLLRFRLNKLLKRCWNSKSIPLSCHREVLYSVGNYSSPIIYL